MTTITMTPLKSDNLAGYHYDAASGRLTIEFKPGKGKEVGNRYRYSDVPIDVAEKLAEAESPGTYFTNTIRNAGYGAMKLLTDAEKEAMVKDGVDPVSLVDK